MFDVGKFSDRDIGDDVTEVIHVQDRARPTAARGAVRAFDRQPQIIIDSRSELGCREARSHVRRDRREDIAPVKGLTDGLTKVPLLCYVTDLASFASQHRRQNPVIGRDEPVSLHLSQDGTPQAANTWIDHDEVHRLFGKAPQVCDNKNAASATS